MGVATLAELVPSEDVRKDLLDISKDYLKDQESIDGLIDKLVQHAFENKSKRKYSEEGRKLYEALEDSLFSAISGNARAEFIPKMQVSVHYRRASFQSDLGERPTYGISIVLTDDGKVRSISFQYALEMAWKHVQQQVQTFAENLLELINYVFDICKIALHSILNQLLKLLVCIGENFAYLGEKLLCVSSKLVSLFQPDVSFNSWTDLCIFIKNFLKSKGEELESGFKECCSILSTLMDNLITKVKEMSNSIKGVRDSAVNWIMELVARVKGLFADLFYKQPFLPIIRQ